MFKKFWIDIVALLLFFAAVVLIVVGVIPSGKNLDVFLMLWAATFIMHALYKIIS